MTPHLVDQICLWIALIAPVPLILVFRWIGVALGVAVVWAALGIAGVWISSLDQTRDTALLDSLWLLFGWVAGLLYCLPIFGLRECVMYFIRRSQHTA
jgi:hypothetical protein